MRTAYAFPIPDTGTVIAVMEFFSRQTASLDEVLLEMTADVGRQLGQFVERRRAEHELRERKPAPHLVESNIIGVFFATEDRITEANDAFLQMVGFRREDVLAGRLNWRAMTPPEHHHLDDQSLKELIATKVCSPFSKEYFRKDGSRVSILIGAAELRRRPALVGLLRPRFDGGQSPRRAASRSGPGAGGGEPAQGRVPGDARPRAAQPADPDPQRRPDPPHLAGDQRSAARQAVEMVERQVQH